MATAKELTIDVTAQLTISDDTANRCLRLLEMWMDDHPEDHIIVEKKQYTDGVRHEMHIERG